MIYDIVYSMCVYIIYAGAGAAERFAYLRSRFKSDNVSHGAAGTIDSGSGGKRQFMVRRRFTASAFGCFRGREMPRPVSHRRHFFPNLYIGELRSFINII